MTNSLKELGFNSFYVKIFKNSGGGDDKNNIFYLGKESDISEVSLDPQKIYSDINIKYIYNENQRAILSEENFNKKFKESMKEIYELKDLNNNSRYYYKYEKNVFKRLKNYNNIISNFYHFKDSISSRVVYLYGPKGCSKTTYYL